MTLAATGNTWLDVVITASIVVPLAVLGVVIWWFFRAAAKADREGRG